MKRILSSIAIVFFLSLSARAAVLIEPYAGYSMGKYTLDFTSAILQNNEGEYNGMAGGLRLGVALPLVFFALDGLYSTGGYEPDRSSNAKGDYTQNAYGVVAGVSVPLGVRLWLGYYFKSEIEIDYDVASFGKDTYEGSAYKAGIGFRVIPLLHFNIEYLINDFDELDSRTLSQQGLQDAEFNSIILTLSVPLSL